MEMNQVDILRDLLARQVREGRLYQKLEKEWVLCYACGHRCRIPPGREGICKVRFNRGGTLFVPYGYVAGLAVDPIEKKPFFHAFPGCNALSFGMLGCDYHCGYCQNWITSQALRDPVAGSEVSPITAEQIVKIALDQHIPVLTSTYNEPLITSEWAVEIFQLAGKSNLSCSYVSNGNATPEVIDFLKPYLRLYKIDLKSFSPKNYRQLGGRLDTVLEAIRLLHHEHLWVEVVTLVIPGFNDTEGELHEIARFLASVSPDIPWHVTAFHQDYRMTEPDPTPAQALLRAAAIGKAEGLHFVYAGNLPGSLKNLENTYCPSCNSLLLERRGFTVLRNLLQDGACPECHAAIPGVWS
jgi:pyruvate formate lyase activating enzyme